MTYTEDQLEPVGTMPVVGDFVCEPAATIPERRKPTKFERAEDDFALADMAWWALDGFNGFRRGRYRVLKRAQAAGVAGTVSTAIDVKPAPVLDTMAALFAFWAEHPEAEVVNGNGGRYRLRAGMLEQVLTDDCVRRALYPQHFPFTPAPAKPLRDVFADPRVGDVIARGSISRTVRYVGMDGVAYFEQWPEESCLGAYSRDEWAAFAGAGWTVKHRAEGQ